MKATVVDGVYEAAIPPWSYPCDMDADEFLRCLSIFAGRLREYASTALPGVTVEAWPLRGIDFLTPCCRLTNVTVADEPAIEHVVRRAMDDSARLGPRNPQRSTL